MFEWIARHKTSVVKNAARHTPWLTHRGKANGEVFEDTRARGKPIVIFWGKKPYTGGLCEGVEQGMQGMRAGGRRVIKVRAARVL